MKYYLMKRAALALLTLACAQSLLAQQPNTFIKAAVKGIKAGEWIYYNSMNGGSKDSVQAIANGFSIQLHIPEGEADLYTFRIGKSYENGNFMITFVQPGQMNMTGEGPGFTSLTYAGSAYAKDLADYLSYSRKKRAPLQIDTLRKQIMAARKMNNKEAETLLTKQLKAQDSMALGFDKQWIASHTASPVVAYPLFFTIRNSVTLAEQEKIIGALTPAARNTLPVKKMLNSIKVDKLAAVGRPALDFTQNDTAGKPVSLKDFRGKYVLIDFWASWCVPCRAENPNVVKVFNAYKSKGFTVLGVSFDQPGAKDKWLKAIHEDGLWWTQVSDLKFWNNAVGQLYDIHSIPSNVLVNPAGIIVGKNLRGEHLEQVLDSLLGSAGKTGAAGTFSINGTVTGLAANSIVSVRYKDAMGKPAADSAVVAGGHFVLKGSVSYPQQVYLVFKETAGVKPKYLALFLEAGDLTLNGDVNEPGEIVITGGAVNTEYAAYSNLLAVPKRAVAPFSRQYTQLNEQFIAERKAGSIEEQLAPLKEKMETLRDSMAPYNRQQQQITLAYFRAHPRSYITASLLKYYTSSSTPDTLQAYYNRMGEAMQQTDYGKELAAELQKLKAGSPGGIAKTFAVNDITGQPLSLASYKGRYVLLDFWASWCVPCRKGNPHLLSLYAKYKNKGLEIIGVSDDDSKPDAWKAAVEKDGIGVWKHVLRGLKHTPDGGYDKSADLSEGYGIHTLPTKILIDPKGVVIGRYGGGGENDEAMDKKLAEVLGG
jgi:thiol-disulfide isomerase/thioredoxin